MPTIRPCEENERGAHSEKNARREKMKSEAKRLKHKMEERYHHDRDDGTKQGLTTEFLFINLESQLRLAAEGTGNSLSALLDSHPYHVHTHICLCLRTLGVYIMIVNLTFSHCFNVF